MAFAHPRLSYGQEGLTLWLDSERTWGKENKKISIFRQVQLGDLQNYFDTDVDNTRRGVIAA